MFDRLSDHLQVLASSFSHTKQLCSLCVILAVGLLIGGPSAHAQHPTEVTSIVNSASDTTLEVNYSGGLLAPGKFGSNPSTNYSAPEDSIPAEGEGIRMMWYPEKAAFRAGTVGGTQWDAANIGFNSTAFGASTKASKVSATAMGGSTTASGGWATAMGGWTTASGDYATAMGAFTTAASSRSLTIGLCNSANRTPDGHLLVVGNGTGGIFAGGCDSRSDALTLDDSGNLKVTGSFILPTGDTLDQVSDLEALPTNSKGAYDLSNDDGLVASGTYNSGSIPTSGVGTRMMWYPAKAAFRAGEVGGSQWDASKVGFNSVAFGSDTKANDYAATAMGKGTTADGPGATALGNKTLASGDTSIAMGSGTVASDDQATAMGKNSTASGPTSTAMGFGTTASKRFATALNYQTTASAPSATAMGVNTEAASNFSLTIGKFNSTNTSADNSSFVVGNGSGSSSRSDALVLDKDGNLSIGGVVNNAVGGGPAMHFKRDFGGFDNDPSSYVVHVENTIGDAGDALAIEAGEPEAAGDVNYVGFFQGDEDPAGKIEGDEFGGVLYESTGSDYAEELPIAEESRIPEAADVVGVRSGQASLRTDGADRVMIVSTAPIMVGNGTPATDDNRRAEVAFIGQVPTRVRGTAETGDLIVASGENDGTARAVSPAEYRKSVHGPIAGQAWANKSSEGIGKVNVTVGLGRSGAVAEQLQAHRQRNQRQEQRIAELEKRLSTLEAKVSSGSPALASLGGPWILVLLLSLGFGGLIGSLLWRRRSDR